MKEHEDWIKRFNDFSIYQKRKIIKSGMNPITTKNVPQSKLTADDYIKSVKEIIYKNMLCTKKSYCEYRDNVDKTLPSLFCLEKNYARWGRIKKEIFTQEELHKFFLLTRNKENKKKKKYDTNKLFLTLQFLDIKTQKDLIKARKAFPDLVPCQRTIYNYFGGYKVIKKMLNLRNLKSIIEKYIICCYRFKVKRITPYHCRRNEIDIDWAVKTLGSKKKFYELVNFSKEMFLWERNRMSKKIKKGKNKNENGSSNKREA